MNSLQSRVKNSIAAIIRTDIEASQIRCPSCWYVFDSEDMEDLITYHGEYGPKLRECPACEATLMVEEHVIRTFTVKLQQTKEDQ